MNGLGVKTTLLVRDVPLRFVDQEVVSHLIENIAKLGIDVRLKAPFKNVTKEDNGQLRVHLKDDQNFLTDKVLIAMGRPPKVDNLGLENTGIKV
jgi:glutathione reductase (NADPH)